jgi:CelD/BcsL family acetyltransferase involved in cellulose biosynthesis
VNQIRHEVLGDRQDIERLRPEWTASAEREHANLYATYEWCVSLWEAHLAFQGVEFHVFRQADALRGIIPVTRKTVRKLGTPLSMWGLLTNLYGRNHNELILFGEGSEPFLAFLEAVRREPWDLFLLGSAMVGGATQLLADTFESRGEYRIVREAYVSSPYLPLQGSWGEYLGRQSGNFRSDLKRKQKRARDAGMTIRTFTGPAEVGEALSAMYTIETKSWKEGEGTSITTQAHARRFYDVFLPLAAARGWLACVLLELGGRPAAFDMGVLHAGKYYMLKTSYDQEWKDVSPGFVLRAHVIEQLFERGASEHDFLGDPEPWKLRWTDQVRRHENLYLYNLRRPLPNLYSAASRLLRRGRLSPTPSVTDGSSKP